MILQKKLRNFVMRLRKLFNAYIRKILPIPIVEIEVSPKDSYVYRITTYASVLKEQGVWSGVEKRLMKNKRIKTFDGWWFKEGDIFYKQGIIQFEKPSHVQV